MALGDDKVSVKQRWCCGTLLRGRFTRLMRLRVWVNHGSILEPSTTLTDDALGAKAAAEAGRSCTGIVGVVCVGLLSVRGVVWTLWWNSGDLPSGGEAVRDT